MEGEGQVTVWAPGKSSVNCEGEVDRAEIHKIDGRWYLYYSHMELPWVLQGGANVCLVLNIVIGM
jgi:GH43 family beta-xylosidase